MKVNKRERLTWKQMQIKYPDKWLIIDDAEKDGATLISGVVIEVCTDKDIIETYMKYLSKSKHYIKKRTKEIVSIGVLYGENYSIEVR